MPPSVLIPVLVGTTIASSAASIAVPLALKPDIQKAPTPIIPNPPPIPETGDDEVEAARRARKHAIANRRGRSAAILTDPTDETPPKVGTSTLLG